MSVAGAFLPPRALAIERSSNVTWLRRDRGELWFEARGYDPDAGGQWTRAACAAAWIAPAGDAIALLADDTVMAFAPALARPLFHAPGLGEALAVARAAVIDPVMRRAYVATASAVIALGEDRVTTIAPLAARALALSTDRRRLYAATATTIACVTLADTAIDEVAPIPAGGAIGALASSPAGLAATATIGGGAALVGVSLRHAACHVLRTLPAELAGAPVVVDHAGTVTLAAPDRLYRCGLDGADLAVCFAPAAG